MEKIKKLIIVGAGETAMLAYEYFTHDSEFDVVCFAVDKDYIKQNELYSLPVIPLDELTNTYPPTEYYGFVAMSSGQLNRDRANIYQLMKEKGYTLISYISSQAFVWHNVKIGDNCFILENNTLQPFVEIGNNVTLWSGNHIGHSSKISNHCFLTSHVVVSGFCFIGEYSFLGVNSTLADEVVIGNDNFIGMGAIINRNTEADKVYTATSSEPAKVSAKKFCKVKV